MTEGCAGRRPGAGTRRSPKRPARHTLWIRPRASLFTTRKKVPVPVVVYGRSLVQSWQARRSTGF